MNADDMVRCPLCAARFQVVWPMGADVPEYCPFCGGEVDYGNGGSTKANEKGIKNDESTDANQDDDQYAAVRKMVLANENTAEILSTSLAAAAELAASAALDAMTLQHAARWLLREYDELRQHVESAKEQRF